MPTSGTPWYLTVAVAIIAVGGTLLSQILSGRNEKRRSLRDQAFQRSIFWREKQGYTYNDFLRDAHACRRSVNPVLGAIFGEDKPTFQSARALVPDPDLIRLIAPTSTWKLAEQVSETLRALVVIHTSGASSTLRQLEAVEVLLNSQMRELVAVFRSDLDAGPKYEPQTLEDVQALMDRVKNEGND